MHFKKSARGFTLLEILVALVIFLVLITAIFNVVRSSLKLYDADQSRLGAMRNGRSVLDILGSDVRQAGERLGSDFPAIIISNDASGNAILTLRRGLVSGPLPLCSILPAAGNPYLNAFSPSKVTFANGTINLPQACGSSLQDLTEWNTQIGTNNNTTVYIWDADNKTGQFTTATGVPTTNSSTKQQRLPLSSLPSFDPTRASQSAAFKDMRIYLLEERRYSVAGGLLMLASNNQTAVPAAPNVVSFNITPFVKNGGSPTSVALPFPSGTYNWKNLAYLEITIVVNETSGQKTVQKTMTERYTPRNSGSAD